MDNNLPDQNVILRNLIESYIRNWKWFVIGALISFITSFVILRYATPLYQVKSSIKIKDEAGSGAISELKAFEDMGMFINQQRNVINEIEVIESRDLLASVVKSLKINVKYYEKGKTFFEDAFTLFRGRPLEQEIYKNNPISINFFESDSIIFEQKTVFELTFLSSEKFHFKEINDYPHYNLNNIPHYKINKEQQPNVSYGNTISTTVGDIIITPNVEFYEKYLNKTIIIKIFPLQNVISSMKKKILVSSIDETEIINLEIKTNVKQKGIDILNYLIMHYNQDAVDEKSLISENTSNFISNRLKVVSEELSLVDKSIEDYRTQYNIIDIESQTGINLKNESVNQQKIIEANTQLSMIEAMEDYMTNQNEIDVLPSNLGFADASLVATIDKYNELILRRNDLLKNVSELHPAIVNLDDQLIRLKSTISQSIINIKNSLQITIDGLIKQGATLDSKLFASPKKEREFIDIARQQTVKEALYLYLLEKREEITISLGITTVNAKIIDSAYSSRLPIYPKKWLILIVTLLIGLLIPFFILFAIDIIDTKIHSRADIEKLVRIPIIGEIPYTVKKKKRLITKDDRSSASEAFRLVRTNLDFMLTRTKNKSKVVMVTSTIGNEGKTFVAMNMAKTLALSDNKVLLLGLDLRAPTISKTLNLKKGIGVTNFIKDKSISIDDITNQFPDVENLDLITSGLIPPNPAELLMSKRLEKLFKQVNEEYDYIIVDTSPLSLVTDTLILNKFADLFIYVIRAEFLDRRMLKVPETIFNDGKLNHMSILVNGIRQKNDNYGYGYGYGNSKSKPWYKKVFS